MGVKSDYGPLKAMLSVHWSDSRLTYFVGKQLSEVKGSERLVLDFYNMGTFTSAPLLF